MKYTLVNPFFKNKKICVKTGSNKKELDDIQSGGATQNEIASNKLWEKLAVNIKHHTPTFYFSMKDENNNITHYNVKEKIVGGKVVSKVEPYTDNDVHNHDELLSNNDVLDDNQDGGSLRKKNKWLKSYLTDDSSDSSSSNIISHKSLFKKDFDSSTSTDSDSSSNSSSDEIILLNGLPNSYGRTSVNIVTSDDPSIVINSALNYYPTIYGATNFIVPSFESNFSPFVHFQFDNLPKAVVNLKLPIY